jgi:hypothetical protein
LRAEGFSCGLYVLYGGLKIFVQKKRKEKISAVFFSLLVIKTLDPNPDSLDMLDSGSTTLILTQIEFADVPGPALNFWRAILCFQSRKTS